MAAVPWYDEAAHAFTGFAGMAAIGYLYARGKRLGRGHVIAWCTVVGVVLGVGWEILEGLAGNLDAWDTASDVLVDGTGALAGGVFTWQALRAGRPVAAPAPTRPSAGHSGGSSLPAGALRASRPAGTGGPGLRR